MEIKELSPVIGVEILGVDASAPISDAMVAEMRDLLSSGSYPSRNPDQNMADLKAQIAACEKGVTEIRRMVRQFGLDVVKAYTIHVRKNAEEAVRRAIAKLDGGSFAYEMDDGAVVKVTITIDREAREAVAMKMQFETRFFEIRDDRDRIQQLARNFLGHVSLIYMGAVKMQAIFRGQRCRRPLGREPRAGARGGARRRR